MNPKEKAIELVNEYEKLCGFGCGVVGAEKCVDEIINCKHGWNKSTSKFVEYWNQVKEEITKL